MKNIVYLVVMLSVMLVTPAFAADMKIGFVDLQLALNKSVAGQNAVKELRAKMDGYNQNFKEKEEELKKLQKDLEEQKSFLNPEDFGKRERKFQQKLKDAQRFKKDVEEEIRRMDAEQSYKITTELAKVAEELGQKGGYMMIVERTESGILYGDKAIDLTEQLIQEYDNKQGK